MNGRTQPRAAAMATTRCGRAERALEVGAIDRHQIDQVRVVEQFRLAHVETFALKLGQYNARGEFKTDFRCITMDSAMPRAASPPVRSTTISMVSVERLPGEINPIRIRAIASSGQRASGSEFPLQPVAEALRPRCPDHSW